MDTQKTKQEWTIHYMLKHFFFDHITWQNLGHRLQDTLYVLSLVSFLLFVLVWLQKATPSPSVRWSVVNLLAAYAVTTRVYNGDHHSAALEASATLVGLCASLGANQLFEGPELAVAAVHLAAVDVRLYGVVVGW